MKAARLPWAEKALRDECWPLRTPNDDMEPDDALRDAAFRIGQMVAGGSLDGQLALDAIMDAATVGGLTYPEARMIVADAFSRAERTPRFPREIERPSRRLITASVWAAYEPTPRTWFLDGWIPAGTTTVFYGDGGTGKSLVAQQIATAAAAGAPFLGYRVKAGPAFCLFCEDDEGELQRRQVNINAALGVAMTDLEDLHILPAVGEDNLLMTFDRHDVGNATEFGERFAAMAEVCEPVLIVIDTAADTFGGDEIRKSHVRQFIGWCNGLALRTGAAVVLLAHPSRSGMSTGHGASGNTAWVNSARSHLYLTRPDETDGDDTRDHAERVLTRLKSNYSAKGEKLHLAWEAGAFVLTDPPIKSGPKVRLTAAQTICLNALQRAIDEGGQPSPGGPIPHAVRVAHADLWRQYAYSMGVSESDAEPSRRRAFYDTRKSLQAKGLVGFMEPYAWIA